MTREILFKAKLKDWKTNPVQNKWVEGFYLQREETTYCVMEDYERNQVKTLHFIAAECMTDWGLPNEFRLYEIDPDTLCQYINFEDDNKNKIWENDIVECNYDGEEMVRIVIYDEDELDFKVINGEKYYQTDFEYIPSCDYLLVLGNIFDNPDLLDVKHKWY